MAGDDHLPPEIWREVIAGLPAKSILRFRSVCKSWYSLISCPSFKCFYSKTLNKNRNRLLLQLYDKRPNLISFTSLDESFMVSREHDDFAETFHGIDVQLVGACNGLICLTKITKGTLGFLRIKFFIWNPAIRKVVEVRSRNHEDYPSYLGFGFDSKTSDYKVLCVVDNVYEIFYLRKGVWRIISPLISPRRVGLARPECYLDVAVHWSGKKHPNSNDMILQSFNMSEESFRDIKMPDFTELASLQAGDDGYTSTQSVTFHGLIYVITWSTMQSCSVWVMKEYGVAESWTKVSSIDLSGTRVWPQTPLLWVNGEVLMEQEDENIMTEEASGLEYKENLVLFDTERRRFECVFSIIKGIRQMCLYEESLVLM